MKPYFFSISLFLLLAAGLFSSATLQAGALGHARPGFRDGSPVAISAPAPEPEPVPAKKARNWPAIASMIAAGTELLVLILFNALAATPAGSVILIALAALGMAVGCFSLIQGLVQLRRIKQRGSTDPGARRKARNAVIWGAIANFPLILILIAAFTFEL